MARERLPVATATWVCYPNFITCNPHGDGKEHLLRFSQAGYHADLNRLNGHAFFECKQCDPPTYMFAVFSTQPNPAVTVYEISREDFLYWQNDASNETFTTQEMLFRLRDPEGRSYNPYWRPPRT